MKFWVSLVVYGPALLGSGQGGANTTDLDSVHRARLCEEEKGQALGYGGQ